MSWCRRHRRRRPGARGAPVHGARSSNQPEAELLLHEQRRRAEHDDVVVDVAELDLGVVREEAQDARSSVQPDFGEPLVAERRDSPDEQDVANVEDPDQPADGDTELARGVEHDPSDGSDAGEEGSHEAGLVGDRGLDRGGRVEQRPHARHRLEATSFAAAARRVHAAHRDMPELARAIAIALEELAIQDDPGADAAADPDHDEVVRAWAAKEGELGQGGGMTVVRGDDPRPGALFELRPEAKLRPVQDRPADGARAGIDHTRRTDTDPEEWRAVVVAQRIHEAKDELDSCVTVASVEWQVDRAQDLPAQVDDRSAELRLTQVESDQMATVRSDAEQD